MKNKIFKLNGENPDNVAIDRNIKYKPGFYRIEKLIYVNDGCTLLAENSVFSVGPEGRIVVGVGSYLVFRNCRFLFDRSTFPTSSNDHDTWLGLRAYFITMKGGTVKIAECEFDGRLNDTRRMISDRGFEGADVTSEGKPSVVIEKSVFRNFTCPQVAIGGPNATEIVTGFMDLKRGYALSEVTFNRILDGNHILTLWKAEMDGSRIHWLKNCVFKNCLYAEAVIAQQDRTSDGLHLVGCKFLNCKPIESASGSLVDSCGTLCVKECEFSECEGYPLVGIGEDDVRFDGCSFVRCRFGRSYCFGMTTKKCRFEDCVDFGSDTVCGSYTAFLKNNSTGPMPEGRVQPKQRNDVLAKAVKGKKKSSGPKSSKSTEVSYLADEVSGNVPYWRHAVDSLSPFDGRDNPTVDEIFAAKIGTCTYATREITEAFRAKVISVAAECGNDVTELLHVIDERIAAFERQSRTVDGREFKTVKEADAQRELSAFESSLVWETEQEALSARKKILTKIAKLKVDGDWKLERVDAALRQFDIAARTVDGVLYKTRAEADRNAKMVAFAAGISWSSEKEAKHARKRLLEQAKKLKVHEAYYLQKVDLALQKYERDALTVNGIVFKTRAEAGKHRLLFDFERSLPIDTETLAKEAEKLVSGKAVELGVDGTFALKRIRQAIERFEQLACIAFGQTYESRQKATAARASKVSFIEAVKRLIREMGEDQFYLDDAIPAKKHNGACGYLRGEEGEGVFALIDTTFFGSGKEGMVFSQWGIRWNTESMCESKVTGFKWQDFAKLPKQALSLSTERCFSFGADAIYDNRGSNVDSDKLFRLFQNIRDFAQEVTNWGEKTSLKTSRKVVSAVPDLKNCFVTADLEEKGFFRGQIPEKKLRNACSSMGIREGAEDVLALFDATAFGSSKDGFAFTSKAIYFKNLFESPLRIEYENIREVIPDNKVLVVNGMKFTPSIFSANLISCIAQAVIQMSKLGEKR